MSHVVLKTVKNKKDHILWQALYIDNVKSIENFNLDVNKVVKAFEIKDSTIIKIVAHENNSLKIPDLFPKTDEFNQLNINEEFELKKNDIIWIKNYKSSVYNITGGKVTVKQIYNTPISNMIWDKECANKTVTWFSCKEIPGLFCWTKLVKIQKKLKKDFADTFALISKNITI